MAYVSGVALAHLTRMVRGAHAAVSSAASDAVSVLVGPLAGPGFVVADVVAGGVYAAVGLGLRAGAALAGAVAAERMRADDDQRRSLHDASKAPHVLAVGHALWGEGFGGAPTLTPAMHVRRGGRAVPLTTAGVRAAYGPVTGQVAVFVHGWGETDRCWRYAATKREPYADRLAADLGLTPVLVRYNSGLRISANGRALDAVLAELVAGWPVAVDRIVLIGHSMGGLVIHSALAQAGGAWADLVTDTVTLGTPHHGAPLARGVQRADAALATTTRGRWAADLLGTRTGGVRDLEHGNVVAADWSGRPPDGGDHRTHPAARAQVRHHAVVAVAPGFSGAFGARVGDLVVPVASAEHVEMHSVASRFAVERVEMVRGVTHLGLVNDERVYAALTRWLSAPCAILDGAPQPPGEAPPPCTHHDDARS